MINKILRKIRRIAHKNFMKKRFNLFLKLIKLKKGDLIVDLGGGSGEFMELLSDKIIDYRIIIADLDENALNKAEKKGFKTIVLKENEKLPFYDNEVDVVFCNSVIEHVTISKSEIWTIQNGNEFETRAFLSQQFFAKEIQRISRSYFVQTPHRSFPIESHTFFPFTYLLSRKNQIKLIKFLNSFWVKKTSPDWNLLNKREMKLLFNDAEVLEIYWLGFPKELIAFKIDTLK